MPETDLDGDVYVVDCSVPVDDPAHVTVRRETPDEAKARRESVAPPFETRTVDERIAELEQRLAAQANRPR